MEHDLRVRYAMPAHGGRAKKRVETVSTRVAVGMRVTPHPPHGPVLALLTHTVLTSDVGMFSVEAHVRIRLQNVEWWK